MDDPNKPSQNQPVDQTANVPPVSTDEQKVLDEVKTLEIEEQKEATTDAEVIEKREEEGKEIEKEEQNPGTTPPEQPTK